MRFMVWLTFALSKTLSSLACCGLARGNLKCKRRRSPPAVRNDLSESIVMMSVKRLTGSVPPTSCCGRHYAPCQFWAVTFEAVALHGRG
jgi:hypothetical protein